MKKGGKNCFLIPICGFFAVSLLACAPLNEPKVDSVTSLDLSKNAIALQPTSFRSRFEDGRKTWERALLFVEHFLERTPVISSGSKGKNTFPETRVTAETDRFSYLIVQRMEKNSIIYAVEVSEKGVGISKDSEQNARNAARFLQSGQLEVSLLVK